jgi:hypothetical protein
MKNEKWKMMTLMHTQMSCDLLKQSIEMKL